MVIVEFVLVIMLAAAAAAGVLCFQLVDEKLYTRMRAKAEERRMGRWDKMLFEVVEDENHPLSEDITLVYAR